MTPTTTAPQATPLVSSQRFGKIFKLIVIAALVAIFGNWVAGKIEQAAILEEADRKVVAIVPEITLSCGSEKEYVALPVVSELVLIVGPTGKDCWTKWLVLPEVKLRRPNIYDGSPEGDLEVQWAVRDGEVLPAFHASPREKPWNPRNDLRAVRYQNQGDTPIKIPVNLFW